MKKGKYHMSTPLLYILMVPWETPILNFGNVLGKTLVLWMVMVQLETI